jgi:hypothetical protein
MTYGVGTPAGFGAGRAIKPAAALAEADLHCRAALDGAGRKHLSDNDVRDGHPQPIREGLILACDVLQPLVERSDAQ